MITAKEAKHLYDQSGEEVNSFLKNNVNVEVKTAAMAGLRNVVIYLGSLDTFSHLDQKITPLQKAVATQLIGLGYKVSIKLYDQPYIPRGLQQDDGSGPTYQNYGLHIGW